MSEIITAIIVSVIASSGFWTFLQYGITARKTQKSVDRRALLALLHDRLYNLLSEYIHQGHISREDYENIIYLYEPYLDMGGNGTCARLIDEVKKLPIKN